MLSHEGSLDLSWVAKAKPKKPESAGANWTPLPHGDLVREVLDQSTALGWQPSEPALFLSRGGQDLTAALTFGSGPGRYTGESPLQVGVGFESSNRNRKQTRFYVGVAPAGERTGVVTHSFPAGRRYRGTFDLAGTVAAALAEVASIAKSRLPATVRELERAKLDEHAVNGFLMLAGSGKKWETLMPPSRVFKVKAEYEAGGFGTAFGLALAFARVAQMNPPENRLHQAHRFFCLLTGQEATAAV